MDVSHIPGTLKKFGRTPWKFQSTFSTPLNELDCFVSTILSTRTPIEQGCVAIDEVVFEPERLIALLAQCSRPKLYGRDWCFTAVGRQHVQELLCAVFADWVDFLFVPTPKPFVIYADHDEYATFYANTKSNLNGVVSALLEACFEQVPNWKREL